MTRVLLSWSSGKDSAWALHILGRHAECEIVGLLTTLNQKFDRVAMHGTRRSVLDAQARAAGLPLWDVPLPWPCSNADYEARMREVCGRAIDEKIDAIAFGDLFLEDIRTYREKHLRDLGLQALFPLWRLSTAVLAREMIAGGLRAKLTCVDTQQLPADFVGKDFDERLLAELPSTVDPCGERGEFHTCVYAGPMLNTTVDLEQGEVVMRDQFAYADFLPAAAVCA